jgi:WD40 repeat protein
MVGTIRYENEPGTAVFSPDAKHLVTDDGMTLRVWDVDAGRELAPIKGDPAHTAPVFSRDLSPENSSRYK